MKTPIQTIIIIIGCVLVFAVIYLWLKYTAIEEQHINMHKKIIELDKKSQIIPSNSQTNGKKRPDTPVMSITYQSEYTKNPSGAKYAEITKSDAAKIIKPESKSNQTKQEVIPVDKKCVNSELCAKVEYVDDADSAFNEGSDMQTLSDDFSDVNAVNLGANNVNLDISAANLDKEVPSELPPELRNSLSVPPSQKRKLKKKVVYRP